MQESKALLDCPGEMQGMGASRVSRGWMTGGYISCLKRMDEWVWVVLGGRGQGRGDNIDDGNLYYYSNNTKPRMKV